MILDLNYQNDVPYKINQYDKDTLDLEILNDGLKLDMTGIVFSVFLKNSEGLYEANYTVNNNIITVYTSSFSSVKGITGLQVVVEKDNRQVKTFLLNINVNASVLSGQSNSVIVDGVQALNEANLRANKTIDDINKAIADGSLNNKVDKVAGKGLSTNDYNDTDKIEVSKIKNKVEKGEVYLKSNGININDFDEPTRNTFLNAQGIDVNYVLGADNVNINNSEFISKRNILYNKTKEKNKLVGLDGNVVNSSVFSSYLFIELEQGQSYIQKSSGTESDSDKFRTLVYYDSNRVKTRVVEFLGQDIGIKLNSNEKFISFSIKNTCNYLELIKLTDNITVFRDVKVKKDDIAGLKINTNEAEFIESDNILKNEIIIRDRLINANNELVSSNTYSSYLYLKLENNSKYYYNSNGIKTMRVVVYYDVNKAMTRVVENATSIQLNANEFYVSVAINTSNTVNLLSKNSDFTNILKNIKVKSEDIKNLIVSPRNATFIKEDDVLKYETKTVGKVVMPNGSVVDSAMYDTYFNLILDNNVEYFFCGVQTSNIRTATYYNADGVKTRCVESATSVKILPNEKTVSLSIVNNNTVSKLSKSKSFSNELDNVKINSKDVIGLENIQAYDQDLNTTNNVKFASIDVGGDIPRGTLTNPPVGLQIGDVWLDTTTSTIYPILRVKI